MIDGDASRRKLLSVSGAAVGGAGLVWVGGCGQSSPQDRLKVASRPVRRRDVDILNRALDLEQMAVAGYTAGIPLLTGAALKAARLFLEQELSHVQQLTGLVKAAGGSARAPAASYALGHPRSGADVLRLLHTLESGLIALYIDAVPRLSPGEVRATVGSILANEAQHVSILRSALGQPPIPSAFVTGRE